MRVRLYEIGTTVPGDILRIDRFPTQLSLDEAGKLCPLGQERLPACSLEDRGGELFIEVNDLGAHVGVNGVEIESGPLLPGDQLCLGERKFVVSYEQTGCEMNHSLRVRIMN